MSNTKYAEDEINWAIEELKKKHPERTTREQAVKLLDTMKNLTGIVVKKVEKDRNIIIPSITCLADTFPGE